MIPRDDLRRLAEVHSQNGCAISFYFQAPPPSDKSHRNEAILIKDVIQEAVQRAEREGKPAYLRHDLEKVRKRADELRLAHDRAKVIFCCSEHNIWEEHDVPARLDDGVRLFVNSRFHFRPLGLAQSKLASVAIGLVDRARARFFAFGNDQLTEGAPLMNEDLPRRGRGDGFAGFDGGHAERHYENEAMRHFKEFAEHLKVEASKNQASFVLIGCRDEIWPEVQRHLHSYLTQRLLGQFSVDPALAGEADIREQVERLLAEHRATEQQALVREVMGQAQRDGTGVLGLRSVLQALEKGEVQKVVVGEKFACPAVECGHCGHLDSRMSSQCAVCGKENRELPDVTDSLIAFAIDRGATIEYVNGVADFSPTAIGALLRFRADQNTAEKLAV